MVMPGTPFTIKIADADRTTFGQRAVIGRHHLHENPLFSDESLAQIIDAFPRDYLYAWATGTDPERLEENRLALDGGLPGRELLQAVAKGRFWVNITRIDQADSRFRELIRGLYQELARECPGLDPTYAQGSLVISSPNAVVYLHSDAPPMVLWHVRGRKRVWVYPINDRILGREHLEDIFANAAHEYLAFEKSFDDLAESFDLVPGQWASWPQNAPHRVINYDSLNVSISTEHFTRESRWRARVYCANRFLRRKIGYHARSIMPFGPAAIAKVAVHRAARLVGLDREPKQKVIVPTLRVDPHAPEGYTPIQRGAEAR
jgi:hypothetical protein